jgi:hypothetical protein
MTRVNLGIIRHREKLLSNALSNLFKRPGVRCIPRTAREKGITGKEVPGTVKADTAR